MSKACTRLLGEEVAWVADRDLAVSFAIGRFAVRTTLRAMSAVVDIGLGQRMSETRVVDDLDREGNRGRRDAEQPACDLNRQGVRLGGVRRIRPTSVSSGSAARSG